MDQLGLHEFAKNSENKEGSDFDQAKQEAGIPQGDLIVSKLYNTMLGSITRTMLSWQQELVTILSKAGISPTALSTEQVFNAIKILIQDYTSGIRIGDLIPNIGNVPPVGRMICDGSWIENCASLFPDFYQFVLNKTPYVTSAQYTEQLNTYGQCGFCAVDGNNVRIPTITRPISGVSNLSQTGQAIMDTMRPITGKVGGMNTWIAQGGQTDGAFFNDYEIRGGDVKGGGGRDYSYQASMNSARLGARYNGTETRGKQVQYPYTIQIYTAAMESSLANVDELVQLLREQAQLGMQALPATSGTIALSSGGIYQGTIDGATTFSLPAVSDTGNLNQILLQLTIAEGGSVTSWGTDKYFVDVPLDDVGSYNIIYEYDVVNAAWIVGQIVKAV